MNDIEQWLEVHGLGEYATAFHRERIELSDLQDLTDEDLQSLGLPMGPRKRFRRALASKPSASFAGPEKPSEDQTGPLDGEIRSSASRRQLTIMFADLVGSTAMSQTHDPEEIGRAHV